uniref:Uncharacterized protein n=1 Tax=Aegilops tauschii subsp. strangulata TaxID=200361 RepID=A0A453CT60_AEGTS
MVIWADTLLNYMIQRHFSFLIFGLLRCATMALLGMSFHALMCTIQKVHASRNQIGFFMCYLLINLVLVQ